MIFFPPLSSKLFLLPTDFFISTLQVKAPIRRWIRVGSWEWILFSLFFPHFFDIKNLAKFSPKFSKISQIYAIYFLPQFLFIEKAKNIVGMTNYFWQPISVSPNYTSLVYLLAWDYCCCQNKELNIIVFDSIYLATCFA